MKMIKRILVVVCFSLLICGCASSAKVTEKMDTELLRVSDYLKEKIPAGRKIAFVDYSKTPAIYADYMIDQLISNLDDNRYFIIDRQEVDALRAEPDLAMPKEAIDDVTQQKNAQLLGQAIGKWFGAHTVVVIWGYGVSANYGRSNYGYYYFYAYDVQSGKSHGDTSLKIETSPKLTAFLNDRGESGSASAGSASTGTASVGKAAAPEQPAAIGTYTFWPRPQATQDGKRVSAYLDKAVVRSGDITFYVTGHQTSTGDYVHGRDYEQELQDLDVPARTYTKARGVVTDSSRYEGYKITFEVITGRRFSLSWAGYPGESRVIIEKITLDPDDTRVTYEK